MLVGPANAYFMDSISVGLDSSTTYQIINSIRQSVQIMNKTALISLLQPPPETFELFDDIILISEGQIMYQGPRIYVLDFFESLGFRCPERKAIADYLQEVLIHSPSHASLHQIFMPTKLYIQEFTRPFSQGKYLNGIFCLISYIFYDRLYQKRIKHNIGQDKSSMLMFLLSNLLIHLRSSM